MNKQAKADGQYARLRSSSRSGFELSADEVIALIIKHIRQALGDRMENKAKIYAHHGYFYIRLGARFDPNARVRDDYWRGALRNGVSLRRHSLGLLFRALHGEILTS